MMKITIARQFAALALTTLPISGAAYAQADDVQIRVVGIEARLLYEQSGKMSDNIAGDRDFIAHNTIIGEGSALENASDMVIRAVIEADGEEYSETPLVISVYNSSGKALTSRTINGILLEKTTYRTMMLEDGVCLGEIIIEARMGTSVKRETLNMMCGE